MKQITQFFLEGESPTLKEYWNPIGQEPFLVITWEPDFSKPCSFRRMLMDPKNIRFTPVPDKTNDFIFLKSKNTVSGPFLSHTTIYGPLTPC